MRPGTRVRGRQASTVSMRKKAKPRTRARQAVPRSGAETERRGRRAARRRAPAPGQAADARRKRRSQVAHEDLRSGDAGRRAAPACDELRVPPAARAKIRRTARRGSSAGPPAQDRRADRGRDRGACAAASAKPPPRRKNCGAPWSRSRAAPRRPPAPRRRRSRSRPTRPRRSSGARPGGFRAPADRDACRGCWQKPPTRSARGPATSGRTASGRRARSRSSRS